MKELRRLLSLALALVLLLTGLEIPALSSTAIAEGISTGGSSSVPTTPDGLLSAGEWLYWIEGGVAYVAGYTNTEESALKIPGSLGGYPVVGIGRKAFTNNAKLGSIQIHTNVTVISDDAFEGLSNITIKAYNGSYALKYASGHNFNKVNLSNAAVFVDTVIDLTGLYSSKAYSGLSDSGVTFTTNEASFLKQGTVLYFPSSSTYPTGLAKTVSSISNNGSSTYVSFSQPQWGEVFVRVQGEDTLYVDWSNAVWGEGFTPESVSGAKDTKTLPTATSGKISVSRSFKVAEHDFSITGSVEVALKDASISWDIGTGWWGIVPYPDIKLIEVKLPFEFNKSLSVSSKILGGDFESNIRIGNRKQLYGEKCSLATVPVASAGGVINGYLTCEIVFELSGKFEVSAKLLTTYTFTYQNGKFDFNKTQRETHSWSFGGSAKIGPDLKVYFVLGWGGFSIRLFEADIGLYIVADGNAKFTNVTGAVNSVACFEVSAKITLEMGVKIGLIKCPGVSDSNIKKWKLYAEYKKPFTLYEFGKLHFENWKLLATGESGSCSLDKRTVIYETGVSTIQETHNVNETLKAPQVPDRSGYKFEGWYVNAQKSGFTGNDYLFNFDKDLMPYVKDNKPLYIYAKWTQMAAAATPTPAPVTQAPVTEAPVTQAPVTQAPVTQAPVTEAPVTQAPVTEAPVTQAPVTEAPVTQAPVTQAPVTESPVTQAPVTQAPVTPTPTPEIVHVTRIKLNKSTISQYNDDASKTTRLTATVYPSNASDPSVDWESSNPSVVFVNDRGEFSVGKPGTATITCQSVSDPDITATCVVHVLQHVQQIYIDGETDSLLPGETLQLAAECYPTQADDTSVSWISSDKNVATVNQNGRVTAVGYGDAVITATTEDGSDLSATFTVHVEHELALEVSYINGTAFTQGDSELLVAYISPTVGSMQRIAQEGYDLQWSVTRKSGKATAKLNEIGTTFNRNSEFYNSSIAALICTNVTSAGTSVFTVTCNAGSYSASIDVSITIDGTAYSDKAKLNPSTFYFSIGDKVTIPASPISADSKPIPSGLSLRIEGDEYYSDHAVETDVSNGISVSFDESGVYTATAKYSKGNIEYEVPITFYVQDENGVIHLRVESMQLNQSYIQLVQGKTYKLTTTVLPNDAYNKAVKWSSSDKTIATVSSKGVVTAKKPGAAAIYCEATDGSGVSAMCAVVVEAYLQLDDDVLDYTVYTSGNEHTDLGIVNVTYASQQRLVEDGLNVSWTLTRKSGNASELALEEFRNSAENGVSVTGNIIKLLRITGTGDDEFTLTCNAGDYSDQCIIRVHVRDTKIPNSVTLTKSSYTGKVNEIISINLTPKCSPISSTLPNETSVTIEGNRVFMDALSSDYSISEPENLIFAKAGTYQADVVFSGSNYEYVCPITITVKDENGTVPKNIADIQVSPEYLSMLVGDSANLSAVVYPSDATYSKLSWSSSDTSIASVSSNGVVTAIGAGMTTILVTAPETDVIGGILAVVEDGLTLETNELDRTVFVDGATRMQLDTVMLTEASSERQSAAPEWSLTRVSGNNLTLRVEPYATTNSTGMTLYGCSIILHSVSRAGDTSYELTCTNGSETATVSIIVHAIEKDAVLPASIEMQESAFIGDVDELIIIRPNYICYPANTVIPDGMKTSINGDRQFIAAVNAKDFFVSQSMSTLSFSKAGTYHANYVMEYANVKYVIPLVFKVRDTDGNIPVQASDFRLNYNNLNMVSGDSVTLEAVFTPIDSTNQNVTWKSSDTTVAKVSNSGKVTAVANGTAIITCTPADTEVSSVTCAVTVEDYLTVIPGSTSMVLYIQGDQENAIATAMLSVGTTERLSSAGITPKWEVVTSQVSHSQLVSLIDDDYTSINVLTTSLLTAGTDTYSIKCTAGSYSWEQEYTLIVRSVSGTAPTSISMKTSTVKATVNRPVTIDFTPVLTPSNAVIPSSMRSTYVGLGDFYEARDYDTYSADGDTVTVTFTKTGRYILTRRYRLGNIQFVVPCVITVGNSTSGYNLLHATEETFTVYEGGESGSVSTISLTDHMVETLWGDDIHWTIKRISGNSLNVALKNNGSSVDVFVVDAEKNGTDVWRVTAEFGGLSDSVDIQLTSAQPRGALPESISIADNTITGTIGTWLNVPLGVSCSPAGTMLPDQGDEFWSVDMDAHGSDRSSVRIENGMVRFSFVESGYYTATLKYQSGNVHYSIPIYFEISDEEDVVSKPSLQLLFVNAIQTVYPEGETGIPVAQAVVAETLSVSNVGASLAYMNNHDATWSIKVNSGTAATLKLVEVNANTYDVVLSGIKNAGNITYTVSCKVDGTTYSKKAILHVADSSEERPDPTLLHTSYQVIQGQQVVIDHQLYSKKDGSILQSSSTWNPSSFLAAAGYEIKEESDNWVVTFYKTGTYSTTVEGYAGNLKIQVPLSIQVIPEGGTITLTVMKLPAALTEVEDEAFVGITANVIDLRGTKIKTIGSGAFMNCVDLVEVYLPSSVKSIADNAFYGCLNVTFHCPSGSYAESYAKSHGFDVEN